MRTSLSVQSVRRIYTRMQKAEADSARLCTPTLADNTEIVTGTRGSERLLDRQSYTCPFLSLYPSFLS